jgi:hypothetical protein
MEDSAMRKATSLALIMLVLGLAGTACSAQVWTSIETHFSTDLTKGVYTPAPASVHSQSLSDLYCKNATSGSVDIQLYMGATTTAKNMQNAVVVNHSGITNSPVKTLAPGEDFDLYLFVDDTTPLPANT